MNDESDDVITRSLSGVSGSTICPAIETFDGVSHITEGIGSAITTGAPFLSSKPD